MIKKNKKKSYRRYIPPKKILYEFSKDYNNVSLISVLFQDTLKKYNSELNKNE
jgi:hypothetical protein